MEGKLQSEQDENQKAIKSSNNPKKKEFSCNIIQFYYGDTKHKKVVKCCPKSPALPACLHKIFVKLAQAWHYFVSFSFNIKMDNIFYL